MTIVDTPGAYPGLGAEERGQSVAIAESIMLMSRLRVPLVTVVTGEGGSGGALALATSDRVLMMENAYYSVISPEGCSTILFKDAAAAPRAAQGAADHEPRAAAAGGDGRGGPRAGGRGPERRRRGGRQPARRASSRASRSCLPLGTDELLAQRYERFRRFGAPGRQPVLPPITEET